MEHLVEFDYFDANEAIFLDGRSVAEELEPLPSNAWGRGVLIEPEQRKMGMHMPEPGRPYAFLEDGRENALIDSFVAFIRNDGAANLTARHYLYDIRKFERSLALGGKVLLSATSEDTSAYRRICLEGQLKYRLSRSSWSRTEAALGRFYQWAHETNRISNPPRCKFKRKGALKENTVRMVSLQNYLTFRNLGLLDQEKGACGLTPLRDAAYVELGFTTGMRQTERASLLLCELPLVDGAAFEGRRSFEFRVPETITKYCKARGVPLAKRVLAEFVYQYIREERTVLVDRWQKSGGAQHPSTLIGWLNASGRVVFVNHPSRPRFASELTITERRRLALLPYAHAPLALAEPAALWLNESGYPMAPEGWASMFRRACKRLKDRFKIGLKVTDHMLRHSFAVHWLSRLIKVNLARNGANRDALEDQTSAIYKKVVGDPLRRLQLWMGHASSLTTQIYLTYVDEAIEQIESGTELFDGALSFSDWP
jgi:site-specific recombinase XerD